MHVAYLQNPNSDDTVNDNIMYALVETLKQGRIWALNIGEWQSNISSEAWAYFTEQLSETSVAFIYVPDQGHSGCTGMKTDILDKVRKNRNRLFEVWRSHPSSLGQNIANAKKVTNMWFNPSSSGKLDSLRQELLDSISTIDQAARPLEIIESIDKRKYQAAIVIQKYGRGYLCRKKLEERRSATQKDDDTDSLMTMYTGSDSTESAAGGGTGHDGAHGNGSERGQTRPPSESSAGSGETKHTGKSRRSAPHDAPDEPDAGDDDGLGKAFGMMRIDETSIANWVVQSDEWIKVVYDKTRQDKTGMRASVTINDSLAYLNTVKTTFASEPKVYDDLLEILKAFKNKSIDTPGVIRRVIRLFGRAHAKLIIQFNMFLPAGHDVRSADDFDYFMLNHEEARFEPIDSDAWVQLYQLASG